MAAQSCVQEGKGALLPQHTCTHTHPPTHWQVHTGRCSGQECRTSWDDQPCSASCSAMRRRQRESTGRASHTPQRADSFRVCRERQPPCDQLSIVNVHRSDWDSGEHLGVPAHPHPPSSVSTMLFPTNPCGRIGGERPLPVTNHHPCLWGKHACNRQACEDTHTCDPHEQRERASRHRKPQCAHRIVCAHTRPSTKKRRCTHTCSPSVHPHRHTDNRVTLRRHTTQWQLTGLMRSQTPSPVVAARLPCLEWTSLRTGTRHPLVVRLTSR
jgi:hypothetical protein